MQHGELAREQIRKCSKLDYGVNQFLKKLTDLQNIHPQNN